MIPIDTPIEFTAGIAGLFLEPFGFPVSPSTTPSSEPTAVILVTEDAPIRVLPRFNALLAQHRRDGTGEVDVSEFREVIDGRLVVVVMSTQRVADRRLPTTLQVPTVRWVQPHISGPGLLTFACLGEEWTPATGMAELPLTGRHGWPRDN